MTGWGYHLTPCRGGSSSPLLIGAVLVVGEIILSAFWLLIAVTAACAVLSFAAVVLLTRWTARREAAFGVVLAARRERPALTATATPQVTAPSVQVVEHHHYVHAIPAPDPASAIVRAAITEGEAHGLGSRIRQHLEP